MNKHNKSMGEAITKGHSPASNEREPTTGKEHEATTESMGETITKGHSPASNEREHITRKHREPTTGKKHEPKRESMGELIAKRKHSASNEREPTTGKEHEATTESMGEAIIEVENLCKSYSGLKAIEQLSFKIQKGEIVGFLGPNGAGKSTTLRILCGIMPADTGTARICGIPVHSQPKAVHAKIGYLPENNPLPPEMRLIEYLRLRAQLKNIPKSKIKDALEEALYMCELHSKVLRKPIGMLSKGYRQRLGIADAIVAKPPVLILDEPTIGLDPHQLIKFRKCIHQLRGQHTIIISSHILPEIERSSDRSIIINHGHIVAEGSAGQLRAEFTPKARYKLQTDAAQAEVLQHLRELHPELECKTHLNDASDKELGGEPNAELGHKSHCKTPQKKLWKHTLQSPEALKAPQKIPELLQKAGYQIHQFHHEEPTLENIFLAATKRSWDEKYKTQKSQPPKAPAARAQPKPEPQPRA